MVAINKENIGSTRIKRLVHKLYIGKKKESAIRKLFINETISF